MVWTSVLPGQGLVPGDSGPVGRTEELQPIKIDAFQMVAVNLYLFTGFGKDLEQRLTQIGDRFDV
jgi:hypothetical protein